MDIRTYLSTAQITQKEFAQSLGVSQGLVWQLMNGRCRITAERARDIERVTGGKVAAHELRPDVFDPPAHDRAEGAA